MTITTSTRSHALTFPDTGSVNWFSVFESFAQSLSDDLDNLGTTALTQIQDNGTSAVITGFNHVGSGAYLQFSNNVAGSGVNIDVISSSSDEDISITPKGAGDLILDSIKWPQADGTSAQYMKTDGAGQLSWETIVPPGIYNVVEDTTPQLGGDLDMNDKHFRDINGNKVLDLPAIAASVNQLSLEASTTISPVKVTAVGTDTNIGIKLEPKGDGNIILDLHTWPNTDGTEGQILTTDGAGTVSFTDQLSDLKAYLVYETATATIIASEGISSIAEVTAEGTAIEVIVNFNSGVFANANYVGTITHMGMRAGTNCGSVLFDNNIQVISSTQVGVSGYSGGTTSWTNPSDGARIYGTFFRGQA